MWRHAKARVRSLIGCAGAWSVLAAPAHASAPATHPDWMTGTWVFLGGGTPSRESCRSGTDMTAYSHRGYWEGIAVGDYGRWWVRGGKLVHSILKEGGGGSPSDRGTAYSFDVIRRRDGELTIRNKDGVALLIRCDRDADGWFGKGVRH